MDNSIKKNWFCYKNKKNKSKIKQFFHFSYYIHLLNLCWFPLKFLLKFLLTWVCLLSLLSYFLKLWTLSFWILYSILVSAYWIIFLITGWPFDVFWTCIFLISLTFLFFNFPNFYLATYSSFLGWGLFY